MLAMLAMDYYVNPSTHYLLSCP